MQTPFPAYRGEDDFVFVCYSHQDAETVYPELVRLRASGINIWYDEGIRPGSEWTDELALAITKCAKLLFFVTPRSAGSRHCRDEVQYALNHDVPIVVVYLEDSVLPPGLELVLGAFQAVHKNKSTDERYAELLMEAIALGGSAELMVKAGPPGARPRQRGIAIPWWGWSGIAAVIVAAAVVWFWPSPVSDTPTIGADPNSIALLPLINNGGFEEGSYYPDSVSEDLLNRLVTIEGLKVISRRASFAFRPSPASPLNLMDAAAQLGVRHIVTGDIRREGSSMRLSVELVDVSSGQEVLRWSDSYMQPLKDMLAIQADITNRIASELFPEGLDDDMQGRLARLSTDNPVAYDYYLEALGLIRNPVEDTNTLVRASNLFELAIEADRNFSAAMAGLCETRTTMYRRGSSHESATAACEPLGDLVDDIFEVRLALGEYQQAIGRTEAAITTLEDAAQLNPKSTDARITLGLAYSDRFTGSQLELDKSRARTNLLEAISLDPNYWYGYHAYGNFLVRQSDLTNALAEYEKALALEPVSVPTLNNVANVNYRLGNTAEAERYWLTTLSITDNNKYAHSGLGIMYHYASDFAKAVEHLSRAVEISPEDFKEWGRLGEAERLLPDNQPRADNAFEQAVRFAKADLEINPNNWETFGFLSIYYAYLRRFDEADDSLTRMFELNSGDDPMTQYWAMLVRWEQGNIDGAFDALEKALEYGFHQQKRFVLDEPALAPMRDQYPDRIDRILARY